MKPKKRTPVKPNPEVKTLHHADYYGKIEFQFEVKGVKYYSFQNDVEIPTGRYMFIQNFLQEVNLRMNLDSLREYIAAMKKQIDGSKGSVDIVKLAVLIDQLESRVSLAFEPDTVYRLASCIFFDETELLTTYNIKHNETKIAAWKSEGTLDFFYRKPFEELTGLKGISEYAIRNYLQAVPKYAEKLTSVMRGL